MHLSMICCGILFLHMPVLADRLKLDSKRAVFATLNLREDERRKS